MNNSKKLTAIRQNCQKNLGNITTSLMDHEVVADELEKLCLNYEPEEIVIVMKKTRSDEQGPVYETEIYSDKPIQPENYVSRRLK